MQKILWLGNEYFAAALPDCGWEQVRIHNPETYRPLSWRELIEIAGFVPDVLVSADASTPPQLLGVEEFPCLTVFYSVDSHIHSWHPFYAQAFDACLVSLADHVANFPLRFLTPERIWWSPAFARENDRPNPSVPKKHDCLFVGTDDPELMPKRHRFLQELAGAMPGLVVTGGDYRLLYPEAKIIVNQAERRDLNFRVFEAMGCGCCLVTPRIGNGLEKLFVDGEHYVGYADGDAGDAAYRIKFLLEHPEIISHIEAEAYAEINSKHRPIHRAQAFTDHICDLAFNVSELVEGRIARAQEIREACLKLVYLHWAEELGREHCRAFLAAANGSFGLDGSQG